MSLANEQQGKALRGSKGAPQLPSHTAGRFRKARRFIKRNTARLARRLGKKPSAELTGSTSRMGMEDAPARVIKGYAD